MNIIWATRGLTWGFRFLRRGGLDDPLPIYETVFSGLEEESEVCRRVGDKVALRFDDPLGRRDAAGRVIPHDFVVFGPAAGQIRTLEDGLRQVWSEVAEEYDRDWSLQEPNPPGN